MKRNRNSRFHKGTVAGLTAELQDTLDDLEGFGPGDEQELLDWGMGICRSRHISTFSKAVVCSRLMSKKIHTMIPGPGESRECPLGGYARMMKDRLDWNLGKSNSMYRMGDAIFSLMGAGYSPEDIVRKVPRNIGVFNQLAVLSPEQMRGIFEELQDISGKKERTGDKLTSLIERRRHGNAGLQGQDGAASAAQVTGFARLEEQQGEILEQLRIMNSHLERLENTGEAVSKSLLGLFHDTLPLLMSEWTRKASLQAGAGTQASPTTPRHTA